jgi:hypothetical protein
VTRLALFLAALSISACRGADTFAAPMQQIAGAYTGQVITGSLSWQLVQDGDQITGTGTFTAATDSATSGYTIRGTWLFPNLRLRLVGAPGDSDADSVWYEGTQTYKAYVGIVYDGTVHGSSSLVYGPLALYPTASAGQ